MGILQRIFGGKSTEKDAAKNLYDRIMRQARNPEFFGPGRMPDNYDGRLEVLTVHLAPLMANLRLKESLDGISSVKVRDSEGFSQAIFDIMVEDFDTALREEGFTDTGVKKRIKPIIGFFYKRLKLLTESRSDKSELVKVIKIGPSKEAPADFTDQLADYLIGFDEILQKKSYEDLIDGLFEFPNFSG